MSWQRFRLYLCGCISEPSILLHWLMCLLCLLSFLVTVALIIPWCFHYTSLTVSIQVRYCQFSNCSFQHCVGYSWYFAFPSKFYNPFVNIQIFNIVGNLIGIVLNGWINLWRTGITKILSLLIHGHVFILMDMSYILMEVSLF